MVDLFNHLKACGEVTAPAEATDRVIAGLEGRALQDNASKKLIAYHEVRKGFMGRTSRSRFRRFVSEDFDGNIYIYIYIYLYHIYISYIYKYIICIYIYTTHTHIYIYITCIHIYIIHKQRLYIYMDE